MAVLMSIAFSAAHLRPSSKAAARVTALLGPMPFILQSTSTDIVAISFNLFSPLLSNSLATSITFIFSVPVRNSIASSSVLLRVSAPLSSIFSRGRSSSHKSLIFMSLFAANLFDWLAFCRLMWRTPESFSFSYVFLAFFMCLNMRCDSRQS